MTKKHSSIFIPENDSLLFARPIEMTSALSIDACCERLIALNLEKLWNFTTMHAYVRDEGMNDQRFGIKASGGKSPDAWIVGRLSAREDGGTQITGVVGAAPDVIFYLAIPILMVIVLGIYASSCSSLLISLPVAVAIYAVFIWVIVTSKEGLEEKLRVTLECGQK